MNEQKIVFWFLIFSGTMAAAIALFFDRMVDWYYKRRSGRPSDRAMLYERLLAAFVSGGAFTMAEQIIKNVSHN